MFTHSQTLRTVVFTQKSVHRARACSVVQVRVVLTKIQTVIQILNKRRLVESVQSRTVTQRMMTRLVLVHEVQAIDKAENNKQEEAVEGV